jgi:hypothetical protein
MRGWAKARLRRAHRSSTASLAMVGTLALRPRYDSEATFLKQHKRCRPGESQDHNPRPSSLCESRRLASLHTCITAYGSWHSPGRRGWSVRAIPDSIFKQPRKHTSAISRRNSPELCQNMSLRIQRAQGRPGASSHPRSACIKGSTRQNHRWCRIIRPSLRNGFNGFLRALPGDHRLVATVTRRAR